ncbi:MAG TPA: DUF2235 domain-containing protein, partial [Xanthobacteraceae bacterium]|nr:DUF2235 domain-containing protein [Xanthobacteraceae bacterium]
MARERRDLIVLSDGTGNSASKAFKTNVWRLYQALDLSDGSQVAVFGDGVGNSSVTILRVLGLALGLGVERNVLNLYKFLCHNYWREQDEAKPQADAAKANGEEAEERAAEQDAKGVSGAHDRIWMFGFSRGAFTIRVLAGLVHSEGLVTFETEAELNRNAIAAYRAYRRKRFKRTWWVFWVPLTRWIRDELIAYWQVWMRNRPYQPVRGYGGPCVQRRESIEIEFIGVWDTVVAYGLPIDELTIAVDKWVWPMQFEHKDLLPRVKRARQALALDDERRTFHPVPWDEKQEVEMAAAGTVARG